MDYDPKNLQSVLLYMRQKFGAGIFEEPPRMFSILLDLAPGLKRDGNVLRQMSDAGLLRELRKASESGNDYERVRAIAKSRNWLGDDYLTLANERVEYFMTVLQAVYGLEVETPKAEPPKPPLQPKPQPKSASKPQSPKPAIISSGHTGDCTWTLDSYHVLTISGQGEMDSYGMDSTPWWNYSEHIEIIVIGRGVTSIGDCTFTECRNLSSVSISDSVATIGWAAFSHCYNLTSITIPSSTILIKESAFSHCYNLTSITISGSTILIKESAFAYCYNLTNIMIPDSIISIGFWAFHGCESLKEVIIPQKANINPDAFERKTIIIRGRTPKQPVSKHGIIDLGYTGDCKWTLYTNCVFIVSGQGQFGHFPDTDTPWLNYREYIKVVFIEHGVTSIGSSAFYGCYNLTSVTIPDSVTAINVWAFDACRNLKQVSVPYRTTIYPDAFPSHTQVIRR